MPARWSLKSYAEALRSSPIGVALVAPDGRWSWVNEALCHVLGRCESDLLSMTHDEVTHPADRTLEARLASDLLAGRRSSYQMIKQYVRPDGTDVPVLQSVTLVRDADGTPEHFVAQVVDLTEERLARDESTHLAHLQFETLVTGLGLGSFARDADTGLIDVNDTFATVFDLEPGTPVTFETLLTRIHPDDRATLRTRRAVGEPTGPASEHRFRVVQRDGSIRHVRAFTLRRFSTHRTDQMTTGVVIDETEQRSLLEAERAARADAEQAKDALSHQALHDPLTGLPNRHLLLDRLQHALARRTRAEHHAVLLFVDLDRFKVVNDSLGHAAGDQVLIEAANRLKAAVRPEDLVARLGGDEFVVLVEDPADVDAIGDRVVRALREPFLVDGHRVPSSASVGLAVATPGTNPGALLRDADAAMYAAKDRGRGRVARFDADIHTAAVARFELGSDLEGAATRGELVLHYQPSFCPDGTLDGIEALLRWEHPTRGILLPAAFLPLAEEFGSIVPMGRWVREEAARQIVAWRAEGFRAPRVWCNVSVVELDRGGVADHLRKVCTEHGLSTGDLGIEVTESVLLDTTASAALDEVATAGFPVAIDDFGTGYASLAYLVVHHVDVLKIDKRFVARMHDDRAAAVVVRAVVDLARNLDARSVAEGVETTAQYAALTDAGCDAVSGYLLAHPLPGDELLRLLTTPASR